MRGVPEKNIRLTCCFKMIIVTYYCIVYFSTPRCETIKTNAVCKELRTFPSLQLRDHGEQGQSSQAKDSVSAYALVENRYSI